MNTGVGCFMTDHDRIALEVEKIVVVCDSCFTEACWKGEMYCENYRTAGTTAVIRNQHRTESIKRLGGEKV